MKVMFLRDFRGTATAQEYYTAGTEVDLPEWQAAACLAENVVVLVAEAPPPTDTGAGAGAPPAEPAPVVKAKRVYKRKQAGA